MTNDWLSIYWHAAVVCFDSEFMLLVSPSNVCVCHILSFLANISSTFLLVYHSLCMANQTKILRDKKMTQQLAISIWPFTLTPFFLKTTAACLFSCFSMPSTGSNACTGIGGPTVIEENSCIKLLEGRVEGACEGIGGAGNGPITIGPNSCSTFLPTCNNICPACASITIEENSCNASFACTVIMETSLPGGTTCDTTEITPEQSNELLNSNIISFTQTILLQNCFL